MNLNSASIIHFMINNGYNLHSPIHIPTKTAKISSKNSHKNIPILKIQPSISIIKSYAKPPKQEI